MIRKNRGNILVTLLVFVAFGMIVATGAISVGIVNTQGVTNIEFGEDALTLANSGIEIANLKILRNSSYVGETINFTNGSVVIIVTGTLPTRTIVATATSYETSRKIQATGSLLNNQLLITNIAEIL